MDVFQAILLGILQGITEFFPVSSSGHLVLLQRLLGLQEGSDLVLFDLLCHLGTLLAIVIAFRADLVQLLTYRDKRRFWMLFIATLPLFPLVPLIPLIKSLYSYPLGGFFLLTAVILWCGEAFSRPRKIHPHLQALLIGCAQGLALLPAVSRSGCTIAMGRFLGWERVKAAQFSFLLALPAILGGSILEGYKALSAPATHPFFIYLIGFVISFLVGSLMLQAALRLFRRVSLKPFALYCALIGILLLL